MTHTTPATALVDDIRIGVYFGAPGIRAAMTERPAR
jgi:hypothetical protein